MLMDAYWYLGLTLAAAAGFAFYFLPAIIAERKKKRSGLAIFVLNLFLGWTLIGWVIALVWALAEEPRKVSQ